MITSNSNSGSGSATAVHESISVPSLPCLFVSFPVLGATARTCFNACQTYIPS